MTQRLFFTDDALNCDVDVTHCVPHEDGFAVTLAATPFHPQGGGQPSDTGWIGDSQVTRVMQEQESIVHYTTHPVTTGKAQARVDEVRRRLNARLHSAGHLIGVYGEQLGWVPTRAHHWPGECRVSFVPGDQPQPLEAEAVQHALDQRRPAKAGAPCHSTTRRQFRRIAGLPVRRHPCALPGRAGCRQRAVRQPEKGRAVCSLHVGLSPLRGR